MLLLDAFIVVGPVLGYIEQYRMVQKTGSVGSFSTDICAILLISNIVRVYFWFAAGFGTPLLLQAFLMITAQLLLLKACVQANQKSSKQKENTRAREFALENFWRWDQFEHYVRFLVGLAAVFALSTIIMSGLLNSTLYGELVGYLSLTIEATLGLPQLIKNHQAKSVQGLSISLILSWLVGDIFKTIYFLKDGQPIPFVMCGAIQITVDLLIMLQIFYYRRNSFERVPYNPPDSL